MDMAKPKIRFNGYTEDWEQRKVSELCSISTGKSNTQDKVEDGEYPFYVRSPIIERSTKYLYDEEAVITVGDGVGTGKVFHYVNGKYDLHQRCYRMYGFSDELNAHYFYHTFSKLFYKRVMAMTAKTSVDSVRLEMISDMKIPVPNVEEQRKIGNLLDGIDHLITLHQRKCEQTKTLKKYMLQKMFPQDGEKVPQIRFEGFTEDWEQRKLGDLVDRVTRKNQDLVSELPLTISAQYGLIDQNEFFDKRVASKDVSGYYLIENGEFAYNKSTSTDAPWGAIKRLDRYENGVLSTLYIIFGIKENNPVDSDFLVSYYSPNLWHKGIHEIAAEGARNHGLLNIAPADFFATRLMIPQDIEEQKKIGKYFIELEALITLHQRKCDELKEVKKFMLQNMFV